MGLIDGEESHVTGAATKLLRERLLAEFVGTFFLVLTIGVAVASGNPNAPVAIGLLLGVQIYTFGSVSGGFFNPAVTLAALLSGRHRINVLTSLMYMGVQTLGAIIGAVMAFLATEKTFCFHVDNNPKSPGWASCFILETFYTMALCGCVLSTGISFDAPNHYFGFAIGCTVLAAATACGGFDQGSFNPAVTIGINIANYFSEDEDKLSSPDSLTPNVGSWLVFLIAPFLGALLAAVVFRGTRGEEFLLDHALDVVPAVPATMSHNTGAAAPVKASAPATEIKAASDFKQSAEGDAPPVPIVAFEEKK